MIDESHARIPITVAGWDYDRVRALIDRRVQVEGCKLTYLSLSPEECFQRVLSRYGVRVKK